MKVIYKTLIILISSLVFSSCVQSTEYNRYNSDEEVFIIDEYNTNYNYIRSFNIYINYYDDYIIDNSNSNIFSYYTDIYDKGIITRLMNSINMYSIYELDEKYSYKWTNINDYQIDVQYVGYSGNNRLYNVVMFVDNIYIDSFFFKKVNDYWYID